MGNLPDLIIFDCDGVLVDSEVLSCRCLSEALAVYGIDLGIDQALDLFLGRSVTAVFQHYEALGRAIPEQFAAELKTGVRAAFLSALCPIDDVKSVLQGLRVPHCVASSSDIDRVSFSLSLTGLASHFDTRLYTSQMVARGKPAPDLFLYAAARMQVDPQRALVQSIEPHFDLHVVALVTKFEFYPALDANGEPTEGTYRWRFRVHLL